MAGRFLILDTGIRARMGGLDKKEYTRQLPGKPEGIVSICKKPHYTKSQKKKMALRPQVVRFREVNAEATAIWHDAEKKAEWSMRHESARREGSRHGFYVPIRLWDFIRHELNKQKKEQDSVSEK